MKQHMHPDINAFYTSIQSLYFHELKICISATDKVYLDGWLGAALRNNLLYAAERVQVGGKISLREIMNILPIESSHPLYKEMVGGFPKGFSLNLLSHQQAISSSHLEPGERICFSLLLLGNFSRYYIEFIQAVDLMCQTGIGYPRVPFRLESIVECRKDDTGYRWDKEWRIDFPPLRFPVYVTDFFNNKFKENEQEIEIKYSVPINLYNQIRQKKSSQSYQDRQNGFPGFYQMIRSLAHRLVKLTALYIYPETPTYYLEASACIEPFIQYSVSVILASANLRQVQLYSTPKEGSVNRIHFTGYVGKTSFTGYFNYYIPLLLFGRSIGVGYNLVYGLGQYEISKVQS
ncbi:CRISPR system precrRNA processing endoribonuclease RAMP protein Cas6 [Parabacteroides pacaensis]|uniref:CRISPR system precrRNA processing endoribonuclease RAMP protein Cas6 n=1 Tax=Parabacteroides pacaensis TaxID=2086575 RepID=UPI000D0E9C95|nr:CRISPR system precrRNA processing endoribonuclease RAMP protein Cas6 [Parabacteroides pacaensis]